MRKPNERWASGARINLSTRGGVLEQPAHSGLFAAAGLPIPGHKHRRDFFSLEVWQTWWGYPMKKATWLCFAGIDFDSIQLPYRLHDRGADRRRQQLMSKNQRAATCETFAVWLVEAARRAHFPRLQPGFQHENPGHSLGELLAGERGA